uniref:VWFA domain-containing protein n=1 Tax=Pinguiococcus pyrenoidosus TaxID=172671 RepID=A0A7R9UB54_9STRA
MEEVEEHHAVAEDGPGVEDSVSGEGPGGNDEDAKQGDDEQSAFLEYLAALCEQWRTRGSDLSRTEAIKIWTGLRRKTQPLSSRLCEQLRLILQPMLATRLAGGFRTGKRLDMRAVITYVASGFRRDRIWMRRSKPAKRAYQVAVAIDNSASMRDSGAGAGALAALATLVNAFHQLEIGQIAVASFGADFKVLHSLDEAWSDDAGIRIVETFSFTSPVSGYVDAVEGVLDIFDSSKLSSRRLNLAGDVTPPVQQLAFFISDGRLDQNSRVELQRLSQRATTAEVLLVAIIIDKEGKDSLLNTQEVSFVGGQVRMKPYMEDYPFANYFRIADVTRLPETLTDALRQWFEVLQRQSQ